MDIDLLATAASGMDAQRAALELSARNVAAAEAVGPNGNYARRIPEFRIVDSGDDGATVQFAGSREERGTNVDILTEMIAVMNASRAYESNASMFDVGKTLAEKTIEMGRL